MKKAITITLMLVLATTVILIFIFQRNSIFSKETLRLEILGPSTAKAGDEITYSVKYKNNGSLTLENPKLVFELPENSLTEDSKTRFSENLGDIYPGQEGSFRFRGLIMGKEEEFLVAHAWLSYNPRNLSARYESKTTLTTKIESVPIGLSYKIDSKAERGGKMEYSINYSSSIDYPLENMSIKINPTEGFTIKSSNPPSLDNLEWKIGTLQKNEGGSIRISGEVLGNADDHLELSFKIGIWHEGSFIILKEERTEVAVSSGSEPLAQFELLQRAFHQQLGSIENYGPIPPKAGEPTSYSIVWEIKSKNSDLKNVKISAALPQNVSLEDNLFPEVEAPNFSFNPQGRQVTWSIGSLASRESSFLAFQVILTPTQDQKNRLADLMGKATLYAENQNGLLLQTTAPSLDTSLPDDQINSGGGLVI